MHEKSLERKIKRLRRQIGQKNSKQRKSYKRYTKLYDEYIILQSSISAKIRAFKRKYNQFVHRDLEDMQQFLKTENKKLEGLQEQQKSAMLNVRDEYLEKLRKHPVFEKVKIDNYSLLMEFLDRIPVKLENIHEIE